MMGSLLDFLAGNVCILFFANGLALFAMGLAIALESRSASSTLAMSECLPFLAAFGLIASLGDWLQMFDIGLSQNLSVVNSPLVQALKLICFVLSTLFLLEFGIRLTISHDARYRWLKVGSWALPVVYLGAVAAVLPAAYASGSDWVSVAEVRARVLLYFPALGLASLALLAQRSDFVRMKLATPAPDALGAALAFGLKMLVSGLAAVPILALSEPVSPTWVLPLQFVRTLTTMAIAYFVVRILRVFDTERRRQLQLAIQERFQAQEEALAAQEQACDEILEWCTSMADTMHSISATISRPMPLEETMQVVLRDTISLAGLESGAVFLLDEEKPVLRLLAYQGLPDSVARQLSEVKVGDGLAGWVAEKEELLIIDDIAADPRPFVPEGKESVTFYIGLPLQAGGRLLGVMNLSSEERRELSPQQMALLEAAGHQVGVAIEDARLHSRWRSTAALEERLRLSRELHDSLLQVLGYLHLKGKVIRTALVSHETSQALGELEDMIQVIAQAYDDVRDSILGLRVKLPADQNLRVVLQRYLREFGKRHQIEVALDADAWKEAPLSSEAAAQALRIVQEALTNAWRHGRPGHIWVVLQRTEDRAQIRVKDDGRGFDPSRLGGNGHQGLGLQTMRERVDSVGGSLEVQSEPGHGTEIHIEIPVTG
jgi:signal transduction histidine kinase